MSKRTLAIFIFLMLLLSQGFNALALKVTLEWDIPGAVKLQVDNDQGNYVDIAPDQTSYVWDTDDTYGYIYAFPADGYQLMGAETTDGSKKFSPSGTPRRITMAFYSSDNNKTVKIEAATLERNETFTVDVVNGLANIMSAEFSSGYNLDLQRGEHTYNFNAKYDDPLTITLNAVSEAYSITLNGEPLTKNPWYSRYDNINVNPGDNLTIKVYENDADEPEECNFSIEYASDMEGCIENIRNVSSGEWYYQKDLTAPLTLLENTELTVNFVKDDYIVTHVYLNDTDITSSLVTSSFSGTQSVTFTIKDTQTILKIEGTVKVYGDIDFIGYISNAEGVQLRMQYDGGLFDLPEGEAIDKDIKVTSNLTMSAADTKKYIIPIPEKTGKFFFAPKNGYYISDVYTLTPEGKIELHSGNASMTATIDGTTFYMVVKKLPDAYPAKLNIIGDDFNLRISANSSTSLTWGNQNAPSYSSEPGEREISFIPGYNTPITLAFSGDEGKLPAVYLDGAEVFGIENSDSGAMEYSVTPYSPVDNDSDTSLQSEILVYNSYTERPQMSGASLDLEEGVEAAFYYSPVMRPANPEGITVISGTQITVKPSATDVIVIYKNEVVELDNNGEFVFNATGNARNNVVKITKGSGIENLSFSKEPRISVFTIDGKKILSNADTAMLVTLPKGFYIVNGKKHLVK